MYTDSSKVKCACIVFLPFSKRLVIKSHGCHLGLNQNMFISKDIAGRGAYYVHVEALYYKLEVVPNNITFN